MMTTILTGRQAATTHNKKGIMMVQLYWVGGMTGNFQDSGNWSTSFMGAGGAGVPDLLAGQIAKDGKPPKAVMDRYYKWLEARANEKAQGVQGQTPSNND